MHFEARDGEQRWVELLQALNVEVLTDRFIDRLMRIDPYRDGPLTLSEIRRTGQASFQALIFAMKLDADDPEYLRQRDAIAMDVGVSRARAGVPIEALMTAIRLDFKIIWDEITALSTAADAPLIVAHTQRVWEVVDGYAGQTQQAYVAEMARMQAEETSLRQGYLAQLFGERNLSTQALEQVAHDLEQPLDAGYLVVAALQEQVAEVRVALANERVGNSVLRHPWGDALVVFFAEDPRPGSESSRIRVALERLRCGMIAQPVPLGAVRSAADTALELAKLLEPGEQGAMTWVRGWARMARRQLNQAGAPGIADVEQALQACGETERRRLVESVGVYLTTGSVGQAAAQLYCHRNTLMNRLKRFETITGVNPTVPTEAARLVVGWS
ncbi:helix-turn-helix domain-containing protein [Glutamicibacter creatinolyticus]|uniref:helix-turn-helix domain-containing protein n=1 Tax=Glutamicibacter TaxID=1742989 RepID=UPI0037C03C49